MVDGTAAPRALDVEFARGHFPALAKNWALFENAGGTLAAQPVLDRLQHYMADCQVQPGATFPASDEAARMIAESEACMAEMLNAEPGEVMVGISTSMNAYLVSQALRTSLSPGDQVIVTNLDHEANNGAWRRLEEVGADIREWRMRLDTGRLEAADLAAMLTSRTRLVCFTHCSNITGEINDVAAIVKLVHDAGALACVDGVAYGPHRAIDVKALDADFYFCSTYKFYGPHLALLYGKREHWPKLRNQNHYFLNNEVPLKLNPGGPNHELTASLAGITDYIDALHAHHFATTNQPRRARIEQVYDLFTAHEEYLARPFLDFLHHKRNVRLIGPDTADMRRRAPTFSFVVEGRDSAEIPPLVDAHEVAIRNGDFYAARCIRDLGLEAQNGVIRASMVHYNTTNEVERLIKALDAAI